MAITLTGGIVCDESRAAANHDDFTTCFALQQKLFADNQWCDAVDVEDVCHFIGIYVIAPSGIMCVYVYSKLDRMS
jgi:hypothetical protein